MGAEVPTGYWELDLETWKLDLCGLSRGMFGFSACEVDPLTQDEWTSRIHPDDVGPIMEQLWIAAEDPGHSYSQSFRSIHSDGSIQQILGVGHAVYEGPGAPTKLIGSNIDLVSAARLIRSNAIIEIDSGAIGDSDSRAANENSEVETAESLRRAAANSRVVEGRCQPKHGEAVRNLLRKRARALMKVRRARLGFFDSKLLGEPAFDMLLILYASGGEHEPFSLALLEGSLGLSPSQARRWLAALKERGLVGFKVRGVVQEGADPYLTNEGRASVEGFLEFIVSNGS